MKISVEQLYSILMDETYKKYPEIVITKADQPIAKLIPISNSIQKRPLFGYMKNSVSIHGDIIEPIGEKWQAN